MSSGERARLATWVLTRCTAHHRRDSFIGDLLEQYEERGGLWYWRQALGAVRAHIVGLVLNAAETNTPAADYVGDLILWVSLSVFGFLQLPIYAGLLINCTPLISSQLSVTMVSALIGAGLVGAAITAHEIRARAAFSARDRTMDMWRAFERPH